MMNNEPYTKRNRAFLKCYRCKEMYWRYIAWTFISNYQYCTVCAKSLGLSPVEPQS